MKAKILDAVDNGFSMKVTVKLEDDNTNIMVVVPTGSSVDKIKEEVGRILWLKQAEKKVPDMIGKDIDVEPVKPNIPA